MKTFFQSLLLRVYRWVLWTGLLSTGPGRRIYECLYEHYKTFIEARDTHLLAGLVSPGQTVLDVGANVGFFTSRFARWVGEDGCVIAIEPEETNLESLRRMIERRGFGQVVEPIPGVADEKSGTVKLQLNPLHPADHKIGEHGLPVKAYAIDDILAERNWPPVTLIKIDVQGAEERVLRGARETLRRFHPALFIEIDELALAAMHSSAERVFGFLAEYGYEAHRLGGPALPLSGAKTFRKKPGETYTDLLFLAEKSIPAPIAALSALSA